MRSVLGGEELVGCGETSVLSAEERASFVMLLVVRNGRLGLGFKPLATISDGHGSDLDDRSFEYKVDR